MQMSLKHSWRNLATFLILAAFFVFFNFQKTEAASVQMVKKGRVLLKLQSEITAKGDVFYVYDKKRRKVGKVKVYKVKGNKAYARLTGGKARKGYLAKIKKYKSSKKISKEYSTSGNVEVGGTTFWGVLVGMSSSTATVNIEKSNKEVSLTGSGVTLKGMFDYGIFQQVWIRGTAGLQGFNIAGASDPNCTPGGDCFANINYLSFDAIGRYLFNLSSFRPWIGGGFSVLFPLSSDYTVFETDTVTNTNLFTFAFGADWFMSSTSFVPISIEYNMYPSGEKVSASSIDFRVGYGMEF